MRRAAAVAVVLAVLLGACDGDGAEVTPDGDARGTEVDDTTTGRSGSNDGPDRGEGDDGDIRSGSSTTSTPSSTTTTTTATTSAPPPTTAAPTTTAAPPPPPPTTAAPPPPPPPPPSEPQHGTRNTGCEQYMYDQINAARARAGRGALAFDTVIQYIAVDWSDEMAGSQTLRHNPNYGDQILRHRNYRTAGENVGRGYQQGSLFQAFMDSPGHRANIESTAYSHVTVGCLTDGNGQLWVTQNFWGG